jgi:hypothetical protein
MDWEDKSQFGPVAAFLASGQKFTDTQEHPYPSLSRRLVVLNMYTSIWLVPYQNLKVANTYSRRLTVLLGGWKRSPSKISTHMQ